MTAADAAAGRATGAAATGAAAHAPTGAAAHAPTGAAPADRGQRSAAALERRYRRLLLAYPRSYRRRHGAEILTTLMDAAAPGRDRPTGREARNLLAGGIRQRFRLPVGRSMIAVAVLSALILGALGSTVGSALGWATAAPPPTDADLERIVTVVMGQPARWDVQRQSQVFGLRTESLSPLAAPAGWTADAARARLAAEGWRVGPLETRVTTVYNYDDDTTRPADNVMFVAERNGTEILVVSVMEREYSAHGVVESRPTEPWLVLPLTIAGVVAGLLAGWLLAARVGYRVRRLSPWLQVPPVIAATVAAAALGLSGLRTYLVLGQMVVDTATTEPMTPDRFDTFPPFAVYQYDTPFDPVPLTGLAALLLLLVLAYALPARALGGEPGSPDEPEGLPYAA